MNIPVAILICSVCWTLAVLAWRHLPSGVTEETFGAWWREERGNRQLLRLADYVEIELMNRELSNVRDGYNQTILYWCGGEHVRPACMMAFALDAFGYAHVERVRQKLSINFKESKELFSAVGCGNARQDGDKAVRYVRDFVARRRAVWNTTGEKT